MYYESYSVLNPLTAQQNMSLERSYVERYKVWKTSAVR